MCDKLETALRIVSGVERSPHEHWNTFFSKPKPKWNRGVESVFGWKANVNHEVKSMACSYIAERIER